MSFIYNFMAVLILISSIYEVSTDEKPDRRWFYFIIVMMMFTAGLAYGLSPDWIAYWNAFEGTAATSFAELGYLSEMVDMEFGYIFLNKIVSFLGLGYASFTLIIAIIALWLKSVTIYRYGGYVFMALLMYFIPTYLFEEHVHVRQGLANAVMFFSIKYIIERKLWKFFLCFAIAFMFHKAVIAFVLAYWIVKIRFNNTTIILILIGAVLINYLGLSSLIDGIMQLMPFGIGETYSDYVNELMDRGILGDVVKILTIIAILMFNRTVTEKDPLFAYFRNLYIFGVVIYFFFGQGIFAARLPGFYTVYIIFVIPRMVMALRDNKVIKNFLYISFTTYTILLYVNFYYNWGDRSGFGNYKTSFDTWAPYGFFAK